MVQVTGRSNVNRTTQAEGTQATTAGQGATALNAARGTFDARATLGVSSGALRNLAGGLGHAAGVLAQSTVHARPSQGPVA